MNYSRGVASFYFLLFYICIVSEDASVDEFENGGWRLPDEVPVIDQNNNRCNIERVDGRTLTQEQFINEYAFTKPVIIEHTNNEAFRRLTRKSQMLSDWQGVPVRLNTANTHSYKKVETTFDNYLNTYLKPQNLNQLGNETLYLFGDLDPVTWKSLLDRYNKPVWHLPDHTDALSFGIAGQGTGVPFHFHVKFPRGDNFSRLESPPLFKGPGFAEVIFGSKRWFLTSPDRKPKFDPDKSTLHWYLNDYPKLSESELNNIHECLMKPNELIYFPDMWYHATLNKESSVFISTFLSPVMGKQEL